MDPPMKTGNPLIDNYLDSVYAQICIVEREADKAFKAAHALMIREEGNCAALYKSGIMLAEAKSRLAEAEMDLAKTKSDFAKELAGRDKDFGDLKKLIEMKNRGLWDRIVAWWKGEP